MACVCIFYTCKENNPQNTDVEIKVFQVQPSSIQLIYGSDNASQQINVLMIPDNAADVLWSSDNDKVATVSQTGLVTATGAGITNIHAKAGNLTQKIPVTVLNGNNIIIYAEKNYNGKVSELQKGVSTDIQYKIASLLIPDGQRVKLYRDEKSGGGFLSFEKNQNDLTQSGWFNNIVKVVVEDYVEDEPMVKNYNYVLGAQISSYIKSEMYQKMANEMYYLGSNVIKVKADVYANLSKDTDFRYIYLWYDQWPRIDLDINIQSTYDNMYELVRGLLNDHNDTGKTFYIGNWESDWVLLRDENTGRQKIEESYIQNMIVWLNTRQKAIEDAKRDTPHTNVNVWHYAEANRTSDIFSIGAERFVNAVLPHTTIDYLSYTAYDFGALSSSQINDYVEYMDQMIPDKNDVPNPGKRVFIGEVGVPAMNYQYDQEKHNEVNLDLFIRYFDAGVSQILHWEFSEDKISSGMPAGYWLIDHDGNKWKLYYSYKAFYCNAKEYVRGYIATHGKTPDTANFNAWASVFLKTLR